MTITDPGLLAALREMSARALKDMGDVRAFDAAYVERFGLLDRLPLDNFPEQIRHVLWACGYGADQIAKPGPYTAQLLRTMQNADREQLARLALAYPVYAALMKLARDDRAIVVRMHQAAGVQR